MGGDNKNDKADKLGQDDAGTGTCCGCGCGCDQCFCRFNQNVDGGANRDHYGSEGGHAHDHVVPTLPIDITTARYAAMTIVDASFESFEEDIVGPNDAPPLVGASYALTHANINHHTHSYNHTGSYQEDWLNRYRREVDENPALHFISTPIDTEMFEDEEGFFGRMEAEGSMQVEESVAGDTTRSNHSRMGMSCSRSHSSSASQMLVGVASIPGFVCRPLPLLDSHLPELQEVNCPNCGGEHE